MSEKIKLNNENEYELLVCGIASTESTLTISFLSESKLTELDNVFSNKENTSKILLLSEAGEELKIYKDYVECKSISFDKVNSYVTVVLATRDKVNLLEERVDELENAIVELSGMEVK